MSRDLYFRFSSRATVRAFMRRSEIQDMTGDMFTDGADTNRMVDQQFHLAHVIIAPGTVTVTPATYDSNGDELTPAVMDPRPWLLLKLIGDTAKRDRRTGTEWSAQSRLARHIWLNGVKGTKRGVPMARLTIGTGWVEVYSTPGLIRAGIVPHAIAGGPTWES